MCSTLNRLDSLDTVGLLAYDIVNRCLGHKQPSGEVIGLPFNRILRNKPRSRFVCTTHESNLVKMPLNKKVTKFMGYAETLEAPIGDFLVVENTKCISISNQHSRHTNPGTFHWLDDDIVVLSESVKVNGET